MTDYTQAGHFYHLLINIIVSMGMLSAGAAVLYGFYRRTAVQYRLVPVLISGLFFTAGIGRLLKAFQVGGNVEFMADALAALFALASGSMLWPLVRKSRALPTYEEVEQLYREKNAAYEELRGEKELFETFMENSPVVAFMKDSQARMIYVNRAFEEKFDVDRAQIIGRLDYEWMPGGAAEDIAVNDRTVLIERKPITAVEYVRLRENVPPTPWLVSKFPIPRVATSDRAIGGIAVDISAEHEREKIQNQIVAIVQSTQDAIIGKDLEGNITNWNRGAEILYGYSPSEVIGKNMSILIPREHIGELHQWLDKVRRDIPIHDYRTVRVSKQGEIKDILESVSPIHDVHGDVVGAAVVARDITVLNRQQREIQELNDQLKKRVYQLAESNAALQAARDQALEASNLKSAFVANISHELRTPLAGILGLNELLLENANLQGDDWNIAQMVQQSAEALLTVVNDILDLSKIESGKITLEYGPFNPILLLQDCTRLMAPAAHEKDLRYELSIDQQIPDTVYGDPSRLRQILLNIIGNAIKFTEKGAVQVSARAVKVAADDVVIEFSIKDTGIGISEEEQRFLYMPFAQANNTSTRRFGGTGLGLTISKRFAEMMNGTIRVDSEKGVGSTFRVSIQFDRKKLHEPQEFGTDKIVRPAVEPIPDHIAHGRRVLLVEDNAVLQQLALRQLQTLGIEAQVAVLGREAVDLAMSNYFDLILMDINLPDISGLEATAAIRNCEESAQRAPIPIIAMTAGAMKGDRERAISAGMNDYLSKPVAIEHLKRTIELWLSRSAVALHKPTPPARSA